MKILSQNTSRETCYSYNLYNREGVAELDECIGVAEVMGGKGYTRILVSDDVDAVLIGAVTLETLGLEVDPVTGGLNEARIYVL